MSSVNGGKIWIDLDNSPHVPFFRPIIKELEKEKFTILITMRNNSQTAELASLFGIKGKMIGKHYGKNKVIKVVGTIFRMLQLWSYIAAQRPVLSVSHGSRSLIMLSNQLGIPTVSISDYEYSKEWGRSDWLLVPDIIPKSSYHIQSDRVLQYPGIKEDVYVPFFTPDLSILDELNVPRENIITTIRPPASEAHYHNPEAEKLFDEAVGYFAEKGNITMIVLPRYGSQTAEISSRYAELLAKRVMIIPEKVYDGLNLIWNSDFVISGGGTMNREAAALGAPVYSIFRGKIGAVDHYLAANKRLVLLEKVGDIKTKIRLEKWNRPLRQSSRNDTLTTIVTNLVSLARKER